VSALAACPGIERLPHAVHDGSSDDGLSSLVAADERMPNERMLKFEPISDQAGRRASLAQAARGPYAEAVSNSVTA
jgi:hypothetical protein